jgi:hypothetical protein
MYSGRGGERSDLPYVKIEALLSKTATVNATTNLFLSQMAMLAVSGYMSLLWKTTEAEVRKPTRGVQSIVKRRKRPCMQRPINP